MTQVVVLQQAGAGGIAWLIALGERSTTGLRFSVGLVLGNLLSQGPPVAGLHGDIRPAGAVAECLGRQPAARGVAVAGALRMSLLLLSRRAAMVQEHRAPDRPSPP
jgi:hypothetical protein